MPWSLKIHHIDTPSNGDATLIVAYNSSNNLQKVVLIDGGKTKAWNAIEAFCAKQHINRIDVVVVTHYDQDHFWGIIALLENTALCDNAKIYDIGELHLDALQTTSGTGPKRPKKDSMYKNYLDLIDRKGIAHATALVNSFNIARINYDATTQTDVVVIPRPRIKHATIPSAYLPPHWLLGKDIMWGNGGDGLQGRPGFDSDSYRPPGAPMITCIAANQYVLQHDGSKRFVSNVNIRDGNRRYTQPQIADALNLDNQSNGKSLGFLVSFNNFRYYVGGDLETVQEDGFLNETIHNHGFQPGVKDYLNIGDSMAGRVLAMKTSHHGANTATSRQFIDQIRPSAAFISSRTHNKHDHPGQGTINVLDGYPRQPILSVKKPHGWRHPPQPPIPPVRPVKHYLTSYRLPNNRETYGGDFSETAGVPGSEPGDITLSVTEAQSFRSVMGQIYRGILAAATAIIEPTSEETSSYLATIADRGATFGTADAVAEAVLTYDAAAKMALELVAFVGDDCDGVGVISSAYNAINNGGNEDDVIQDAIDLKRVDPTRFGNGVEKTIVLALQGKSSEEIIAGAVAGGVEEEAALAASIAATVVYDTEGMDEDNAGFAAAAAIGAVKGGAFYFQAAAIAAAIAATLGGNNSPAALTAQMVVKAYLAERGNPNPDDLELAALAGAVAAASWFEGVPEAVAEGAYSAILAAGYAEELAVQIRDTALRKARIPHNSLFTVRFTNGVNSTATITHSS